MTTPSVVVKRALIACNVYISAGAMKAHRALLLSLLQQTQDLCVSPDGKDDSTSRAVVVHAYTDKVYDRSSFHLAGHAEAVLRVSSALAVTAVRELRKLHDTSTQQESPNRSNVAHPFVGLVDHVSMMPLTRRLIATDKEPSLEQVAAGWAAKEVGSLMEQKLGIDVLLYGMAHPKQTPLAVVRREKTSFFQSGGLDNGADAGERRDTATIGAPPEFVENYNVRLRCSRKLAQSLTSRIRERDAGLPGVEALTLPYSDGRWEVACNLLRPCSDGATAEDIQCAVHQWEKDQDQGLLVETLYRVGTTLDQCLEAWKRSNSSNAEKQEHDKVVTQRLEDYLS